MSWKEFLEEVAAGKKFHAGEDREWPISKLTPAETNVLIEILPTPNGGALPQKEVATKLVIDVKTVKSHVDSIYDKFRVDKGGSRITKLRQKLCAEFKPSVLSEDAPIQQTTPTPPPQRRLIGNIKSIAPKWVGRDELLTELCNDLEHHKVLVLFGQGGIGKTSLAVKLMVACGVDPLASMLPDTCTYNNMVLLIYHKSFFA
jgi:DNA-binding CsgD family transcriptional regulator